MTSGPCTEEQVIGILKEAEGGLKVSDLCRQNGNSEATYYRWKSRYGGMEVSDVRQGAAKAKSSRVRRKTVSRLHTGDPSALAALGLGLVLATLLACSSPQDAGNPTAVAPIALTATPYPTSGPVPAPSPTPPPSPTPVIVYIEVTAVPPSTPAPEVIYIEVTPVPFPTPPPTSAPIPATPTPVPMATPIPTPLPTATPAPTGRFRAVPRPANTGHQGFKFTSGPDVDGTLITFRAVVEGDGLAPSQLQVWQSLLPKDVDQDCSTLRPIAFIGEGQSSGVIPYKWEFCSGSGLPQIYIDDVPWLTAQTWTVTSITRSGGNPPLFDWSLSVDLDDPRVRELMYDRPTGLVLVRFAGETLLTRRWVK